MELPFVTLDVFTDQRFGGNPLAVFHDAPVLDDGLMKTIAREMNLSETVFISWPDGKSGDPVVRIFTPAVELPFAGHPLVGSGLWLARKYGLDRLVMQVAAGPVPARISRNEDGTNRCTISVPKLPQQLTGAASAASAASTLSLTPSDIAGDPVVWSAGVPFCFVELTSREALSRILLDLAAWRADFRDTAGPSIFAWVADSDPGIVHGRMFGPSKGIMEDPATGAAAAAFAGLLTERLVTQVQQATTPSTLNWTLHQGVDMGRPSQIGIEVDHQDGKPAAVRISGSAVEVIRGSLHL